MKRIKKIMFVLLFIIIFVAVLIPLSYTLRPLEGENKEVRERITGFYAEKEDSLDIVTVGSSGLFRFVDTPYLWKQEGYTSYNFAFPSLSIYLFEDLLDEVAKTQSPDLIILDMRKFITTNSTDINKVRSQFALHNVKYSTVRCKMINRVYSSPKDRLSHYFDIAVYHSGWDNLTLDNLKYADNEEEHKLKGFRVIDVVREFESVDVSGVVEEKAISKNAEKTLRSILEKCKEKDLEVLCLMTPYQLTASQQKKGNYIGSIVEEYGYRYLDMNPIQEELGLDYSKDFYHNKHVNVFGAEKVTGYLGEYIRTHYDISNEHDEDVIDSWNKAAKEYDAQMEALK